MSDIRIQYGSSKTVESVLGGVFQVALASHPEDCGGLSGNARRIRSGPQAEK